MSCVCVFDLHVVVLVYHRMFIVVFHCVANVFHGLLVACHIFIHEFHWLSMLVIAAIALLFNALQRLSLLFKCYVCCDAFLACGFSVHYLFDTYYGSS